MIEPEIERWVDLCTFFERASRIELGVARSETHQMFGRFEGAVVTDDGARIPVAGMIGWAEEHRARW